MARRSRRMRSSRNMTIADCLGYPMPRSEWMEPDGNGLGAADAWPIAAGQPSASLTEVKRYWPGAGGGTAP